MEIAPTLHPKPNSNWTLIIAFIIAAILLFLLNSCSCDYYLNKAKAKCGYTLKNDTIYRNDTTIVRGVHKDTVFHYLQKDTVIVHEGKLTMKYYYHDSLIYLAGKCAGDTIVKRVPVYVTKTEIKESYVAYLKWVAIIIGLLVGLYVFVNVFKK